MTEASQAAPVDEAQRIDSLDVLRGFALLGILTMNIGSFAMPAATYFDPTAYGDLEGINGLVWRLTHLFADLKFMAIFSMLFGAGIVLMSERAEATDRPATGLHLRRMFWLVVFGLIHGQLLWYGDILYWYGLCGLLVFWLRKRSPRTLITVGLLLWAFNSGFMVLGVSMDRTGRRQLTAFLRRQGIDWPQLHDGRGFAGDVARRFRVEAIPRTLLVDRAGRIVAVDLPSEVLLAALPALLEPAPGRPAATGLASPRLPV